MYVFLIVDINLEALAINPLVSWRLFIHWIITNSV